MYKLMLVSAVLLLMSAVSQAQGRTPVPIVDHENVTVVTASGKPLRADQVMQAIQKAASGNKWEILKAPESNKLSATLRVRNKHTVVVGITYSAESYTLKYQESINMNYRKDAEGKPVIHPFYNRWVQQLNDSIRAELRAL